MDTAEAASQERSPQATMEWHLCYFTTDNWLLNETDALVLHFLYGAVALGSRQLARNSACYLYETSPPPPPGNRAMLGRRAGILMDALAKLQLMYDTRTLTAERRRILGYYP